MLASALNILINSKFTSFDLFWPQNYLVFPFETLMVIHFIFSQLVICVFILIFYNMNFILTSKIYIKIKLILAKLIKIYNI